jgi:membrane fusion protein (multidrug efflux system)
VRYVIPVLVVLALVGGLALTKGKQIGMLIAAGHAMEKSGPPAETIASAHATRDVWEETLKSVGSIEAARGVTISTESPGTVTAIHFESGQIVRRGEVLVELDTSVERAQLASQVARHALAASSLARNQVLVKSGAIGNATLDSDTATLKTSEADTDALQAQIARKTIRAPFAGRLGIRTVNLGQYVNPGTPLAVLDATDQVFADFAVEQQRLKDVVVGTPVRLQVGGTSGTTFDGAIAAIDPGVDASTRSLRLRASVVDKEQQLRPGMFVNVSVVLPTKKTVIDVPATALIHASFGDSVFVVEDGKRPDGTPTKVGRQQFVRVGEMRGDFVAIEAGLTEGQEVVSAGAFKLRNGSAVVVDNSVKQVPQLDPKPENR